MVIANSEGGRSIAGWPVLPSSGPALGYASRLSLFTREDTFVATAAKPITCPDCGLVLRVMPDPNGSRLMYDVKDWKRICKRPD